MPRANEQARPLHLPHLQADPRDRAAAETSNAGATEGARCDTAGMGMLCECCRVLADEIQGYVAEMSELKFLLTVEYEIDGEASDAVAVINEIENMLLDNLPGVICADDDYAILINSTKIEVAK